NRDYILGTPNQEVKTAIAEQIMPRLVKKGMDVDSNIRLIYNNLYSLKIKEAMEALKALVADTPYSQDNTAKGMEEKFQFIVKNAMYLAGCYVDEEKRMINGRADLVARHDTCILIIELKMKNNGGLSAAEQQIRINNYAAPYMAKSKPIYAVALEFDTEARCMTQYSVTPVK
ncbi:MAG: PD-(D/E)XK nuclease domain-containing protein, partial [Muribaculaceae bacterium]|nr:PD-(D/E)XK nuclease domain-containing protein [Muribaculaceae bacterium]